MKLHRSRDMRRASLVAWGILASLLMMAVGAVAVFADGPVYVPNEYIVKATPGTTPNAVSQALAQVGGSLIRPLPLADAYLVKMGKVGAVSRTLLKRSGFGYSPWPIQGFYPNYIRHLAANAVVPNDPWFDAQWGMGLINMPKAWTIQKGSASVTVAVNDSGVADHPDLIDRVLLTGYDFVDNDADPSNDTFGHGTFVSGIIAAQGDNSLDVCGVCWNGVNVLPIRVGDGTGVTTANILLGLDWALQAHADVVNMSYGGQFVDNLEHAKIQELDAAGIILVAAAGNDGETGFPDVSTPAAFPEVIAVAAVGPNDEIASYSSYGPGNEVDIAAPGGDYLLGPQAEIYSTSVTWENGIPTFGVDYGHGTSFACPHVVGAVALLLSAGVPSGEVRDRLESTARRPRVGSMDARKYGTGILDVAAALSNGSVLIAKPVKGSTVTDNPDFKITVQGIDPNSLLVYLDYADGNQDGLPDDLPSEVPVLAGRAAIDYLNAAHTAYLFNWSQISGTPLIPGLHFVYVTATTTAGDTVSDWGTFSVASNVLARGTYLIALPYASELSLNDGLRHPLPQELLWDAGTSQGLDFRSDSPTRSKLVRWSTLDSTYRYYLPGANNIPATNDLSWMNLISPFFNAPTGGGFLPSDPNTLQFPAGSGFWLILQQDAVFSNAFPTIAAPAGLGIPLYRGWNLIGNPFTRQVALVEIKLWYRGVTRTLDEDKNQPNPWVQRPAGESNPKSQFFGYSSDGIPGYVAVPWRGILEPYRGYWIRALVGGSQPQDRLLITLQ